MIICFLTLTVQPFLRNKIQTQILGIFSIEQIKFTRYITFKNITYLKRSDEKSTTAGTQVYQ